MYDFHNYDRYKNFEIEIDLIIFFTPSRQLIIKYCEYFKRTLANIPRSN